MPGRGPQTFKKRQKEQQRKERQQEKMEKRLRRKELGPAGSEDSDAENNPLLGPLGPDGEPVAAPPEAEAAAAAGEANQP
jgi:hypothetical protein